MLRDEVLRPSVILLELHPALLRENGYPDGALGLLEQLHALGYTDASHAGCAACTCQLEDRALYPTASSAQMQGHQLCSATGLASARESLRPCWLPARCVSEHPAGSCAVRSPSSAA